MRLVVLGLVAAIVVTISLAILRNEISTAAPTVATSAGLEYPAKLQELQGVVTRLAIDGNDVYFATIQPDGENSLYRYRPAADELKKWALPAEPGGGWFVGIAADGRGGIWVAWDRILAHVNPSTQQSNRFPLPDSAFAVAGNKGDWVRDLAVSSDGSVWITRNNAIALLRFEPSLAQFSEYALPSFGIPDRVRATTNDQLWLTLARDQRDEAFTAIGVLETRTGGFAIDRTQRASDLAIDGHGQVVLAGAGQAPRALNSSTRVQVATLTSPFTSTASDVVDVRPDGTIALANRVSGLIALKVAGTPVWRTYKPQTTSAIPHGVFPGRVGPRLIEIQSEVTDVRFAADGTLWAANPSYSRILHIVP